MSKYRITHFKDLYQSNEMKSYNLNWLQLCKTLTAPRPIPLKAKKLFLDDKADKAKKLLELWSPTDFGIKRSIDQAKETSLLVYDVDQGTDYNDIVNQLKEADLMFIAHTTATHTPKKHKFRIILPLDKPVEPDLWPHLHKGAMVFAENLGIYADTACKDVSRAYFVSYKTEHMMCDYNSTGRVLSWAWAAQMEREHHKWREDEARIQRELERRERERHYATNKRHPSHEDTKQTLYMDLRDDPDYRISLADKLGCKITSSEPRRAEGFDCPSCGRNDATFYYIDPIPHSSGFCGHHNSCTPKGGATSFSLWYLARSNGLA